MANYSWQPGWYFTTRRLRMSQWWPRYLEFKSNTGRLVWSELWLEWSPHYLLVVLAGRRREEAAQGQTVCADWLSWPVLQPLLVRTWRCWSAQPPSCPPLCPPNTTDTQTYLSFPAQTPSPPSSSPLQPTLTPPPSWPASLLWRCPVSLRTGESVWEWGGVCVANDARPDKLSGN